MLTSTIMSGFQAFADFRDVVFRESAVFRKRNKSVLMGSPILSILAELKLRKLEEIIKMKFKHKIKVWLRYEVVDS